MPLRTDNDNLPIRLAIVITSLWAISFFVDIFVDKYDPGPTIPALMLIVAGYVFRGAIPGVQINKTKHDNGKDSDE